MKYRKIACTLLAVMILNNYTVYADPNESKLEEHTETIKQSELKLSTLEMQEAAIIEEIQALDNKIETALYRKTVMEEQIEGMTNILLRSDEKVEEYQREIAIRQEEKDIFVRNLYKYNENVMLEIIASSSNIFELLNTSYYYKSLIKSSQRNIEKLDLLKGYIETEKEQLEISKEELEDAKGKVQAIVDSTSELAKEQQQNLQVLKSIRANLTDKIQREKEEVASILAEIEADKLRREQEKLNTNTEEQYNEVHATDEVIESTPALSSSSEIIEYASTLLGIPYVWGGTTTDGFDCSGLVQYVYNHFGYEIPRVSQDQQNYGTDVSLDNLQPGDLVFYGSPATHVAMYVKDNYILHAPNTGDVVKIQSVDINRITSAKRIIN